MQNFSFLNLDLPLFKGNISIDDIPKTSIAKLDQQKYLNEELLKFFDSLNLKIFLVETFYKNSTSTGGIHVDSVGGDYVKLNWVFGGGQSKMCWYRPKYNFKKEPIQTPTGTPFISYSNAEVEGIERTAINNQTLVQVGIPHNIVDVTEERFCVSIVIQSKTTGQRLTMEQARTIFEDYIR